MEQGERALISRLLTRRVGELPESVKVAIEHLTITELEQLGEALLDFANLADVTVWLAQRN